MTTISFLFYCSFIQIRAILGKDVVGNVTYADIFEEFYGVSDNGNVSFDQVSTEKSTKNLF